MLDLMRKHAGSWMVKILLGAIVVVFVFWGVGSYTQQQAGILATVNGEVISWEDHRNETNRLLEQVRQNFGAGLNDELLKALQLERQALNQLIDRTLLRQAAARLKLEVSDEELSRSVRGIAAFQSAGAFDARRYQQMLSLNRLTPDSFEAMQREAMLTRKIQGIITDSVKVSEDEIQGWYAWENAEVRIDQVRFAAQAYPQVEASPEETAQYFERHAESYRTEPEVKVRYVRFPVGSAREKVAVTDAELREEYDANPDRFVVPKTVEARHILIRAAAEAPPEAVAAAREKIAGILAQLRAGKDFAELARQHSEDEGSRDAGGFLGAFQKQAVVAPFAEAAFALKPGETSEPVQTQFGWHLIKAEKVNEGRTRSFDEAKAEIALRITTERARNLAYDEAEALFDAASATGDLGAAAASLGVEALTSEFFTRQGQVPGIERGAEFAKAAFQLPAGEVSDILDLGDDYVVLQVVEQRPARVPELAAVAARVRQELIREKQTAQAGQDAKALLDELKAGAAIDPAAKKLKASVQTTDFFKRSGGPPEAGVAPEVVQAAFALSEREPLPPEPVKTSDGYAVIRFRERKPPPAEGLAPQREQIRSRLLQQKRSAAWSAWLEQLRQASEIDLKKEFT
jgi:peptidyl-prolyl cis-trans isomerase D